MTVESGEYWTCNGVNSIDICPMTPEMIDGVCDVHFQAFHGAMNTFLGVSYVRRFFEWFINAENGISLGAKINSPRKRIVGYAIGIPPALGKRLDRDLLGVACWNAGIRPWLFLKPQIRATVKKRLLSMVSVPRYAVPQIVLPEPVMSLVGIAVIPGLQGHNIGQHLLYAFENQAREIMTRSLKLSVYPENVRARRMYEKCGWLPWDDHIEPGTAMYYYKNLE